MRPHQDVPPGVREYRKLERALRRAAWRERFQLAVDILITALAAVGLYTLLVRHP